MIGATMKVLQQFFHVCYVPLCHMKVGPESYKTGGTLGQSTLKDKDECLKVGYICMKTGDVRSEPLQ